MAINPIILQSKANLYTPNVRISDTDLLEYDGDPSLATDATNPGQAALLNAAISSFYCDSVGNLYLRGAGGWAALSTSDVTTNLYASCYDIEVIDPVGTEFIAVRDIATETDPGITQIITEATTIRLKLAWDRLNVPGMAFNAAVPLINGDPVPLSQVDSVRPFDKVQTGYYDYTVADGDITLTFGAEQITIVVQAATKPTATFDLTLPTLPWDNTTEQTQYKENDILTIGMTAVSEEVDMIRIFGGEVDDVLLVTVEDVLSGIDNSNDGTFNITAPTIVAPGTNKVRVQIRAKATRAWSLVTELTAVCNNDRPETTVVHTYPTDQISLKDNELATIDGTVTRYDEILYTKYVEPSGEWDASELDFTFDQPNNTWSIDVVTATMSPYRYEEKDVGTVTYRLMNGVETTYDIKFMVSNQQIQVVSFTKDVARVGEDAVVVVTFDQPIMNYDGSTIQDGLVIKSEVVDAMNKTITYTAEREATLQPSVKDIAIANIRGPSNISPGVGRLCEDAIKYNGFVNQAIVLPSGIRQGNVPVQVDLTNHQGTWVISWAATDTVALTPVFDVNLSGTVTADPHVLLTQNADGTLDFEILYSDVTILETTITFAQNDTNV